MRSVALAEKRHAMAAACDEHRLHTGPPQQQAPRLFSAAVVVADANAGTCSTSDCWACRRPDHDNRQPVAQSSSVGTGRRPRRARRRTTSRPAPASRGPSRSRTGTASPGAGLDLFRQRRAHRLVERPAARDRSHRPAAARAGRRRRGSANLTGAVLRAHDARGRRRGKAREQTAPFRVGADQPASRAGAERGDAVGGAAGPAPTISVAYFRMAPAPARTRATSL
jgi:hypothetical protein